MGVSWILLFTYPCCFFTSFWTLPKISQNHLKIYDRFNSEVVMLFELFPGSAVKNPYWLGISSLNRQMEHCQRAIFQDFHRSTSACCVFIFSPQRGRQAGAVTQKYGGLLSHRATPKSPFIHIYTVDRLGFSHGNQPSIHQGIPMIMTPKWHEWHEIRPTVSFPVLAWRC